MAQISGLVTVEAAGTPTILGDLQINSPVLVKASSTNTGAVYLGNDGQGFVDGTTGIVLEPGEQVRFDWVGNLGSILLDAEVNGEGAVWLRLNV